MDRLVFQSTPNWFSHNPFAQHNKLNHLSSRNVANEGSWAKQATSLPRVVLNLFSLKQEDVGLTAGGTEFLAE